MKNKIMKIMGIVMTVAMLASFMVAGLPVSAVGGPLATDASVNSWAKVNLPTTYPGTDVILLEVDGSTLYAAVTDGTDYWVVKSVDGGYNWTATTMTDTWYAAGPTTLGAIVDMVMSPAGDGVLYVAFSGNGGAGTSKIYRIAGNGTGAITSVRDVISENGAKAGMIYDLDIYYDVTSHMNYILVASDIDALVLKDASTLEQWIPLELIDYDGIDDELSTTLDNYTGLGVFEAKFAPDFATSSVIWAVFDTGNDNWLVPFGVSNTVALASTTGNGIWNANYDEILFDGSDTPTTIVVASAGAGVIDMAFPTGYTSADPYLYLALNNTADAGNLFLCVIDDDLGTSETEALLLDVGGVNEDVCSVEVNGDYIIAGSAEDRNIVWTSSNGGDTFTAVNVFGGNWMQAYMSDTFASDHTVYVATQGGNSGVSVSTDAGLTYVQRGLIDYTLTAVLDLAFGVGGDDKKAVMVSTDGPDSSTWLTNDATALVVQWGRVLADDIADGGIVDYEVADVEVSLDGNTVMLYAETTEGSGIFNIYKSSNNGYTYTSWRTLPNAVEVINDWVVEDGSTIYCATNGGFYGTSRFGPATTELITEVLMSVDVADDSVIVGNNDGEVFISFDSGENWGAGYAVAAATSDTYVAFDANYGVSGAAGNDMAYAAAEDGTIYAIEVNAATTDDGDNVLEATENVLTETGILLDDMNALAVDANSFNGLVVADDNALYASGEVYSTTTGGSTSVQVLAGSQLQLVSDLNPTTDVFTANLASAINITGVVGTFIDGEVLLVIGDNVVVDAAGTSVTGTLQVQGATSGATGIVTLPAITVSWTAAASTVSISSSTLILDVLTSGGSAGYDQGMARILLHERANVWEYEINDTMAGLWYSNGSNILWTLVSSDAAIEAFEDFLSIKVGTVTATEYLPDPDDMTKSVTLGWAQLKGAVTYEIEIWDADNTPAAYVDTVYYTVPTSKRATGTALSTIVSGLDPVTKYTFYVRVYEQALNQSRWSTGVSITTSAYLPAPIPITPAQGATGVSLHPTFTWDLVSNAVSYTIQIASDATFTTIIDTASVKVTGYTYSGDALAYDTDYYWRVQAVAADGTKSTWSSAPYSALIPFYSDSGAVSSFHTMVDPDEYADTLTVTSNITTNTITTTSTSLSFTIPVPEFTVTYTQPTPTITTITNVVEVPDTETPAYIWAIVAIGALLTIAVIVLIIRTRRVV